MCVSGYYGGSFMTSFVSTGDGHYIQELLPQCTECPRGTYQDQQGRTSCVQCPTNFSTVHSGATMKADCIGKLQIACSYMNDLKCLSSYTEKNIFSF